MKRRQKMTWFLSGILAAMLVVNLAAPAVASALQTIQVAIGTEIYVDDVKVDPTDALGNSVPVFNYNGTTYLPVRAISNALGITIQWDGANNRVYVGKHTGVNPAVWLTDMDYFAGTESYPVANEMDNLGNTHVHCFQRWMDRTYALNGQYSRLTGTLYQCYDGRSIGLYSDSGLWIYGDGELLYSHTFDEGDTGILPTEFDIDVSGVLLLEVQLHGNGPYGWHALSLGEVGLWT